jgi:hypothetical protein
MDIEIGSHVYRNSDGRIDIEGVPQIAITLRKPGGPLLVNFVGYDEVGRVPVKMVDSSLQINERRAYEVTRTAASLLLKNLETGKTVLQIELREGGRVSFRQGEFLTVKAHRLELSPTEWRLEKHRISGGESDVKGGSVTIG